MNVRSTQSFPRNLAFKYCRIKHPHQLEIAYQDSILRPKKNPRPYLPLFKKRCGKISQHLIQLTAPENTITYYNTLCLSPQNFA